MNDYQNIKVDHHQKHLRQTNPKGRNRNQNIHKSSSLQSNNPMGNEGALLQTALKNNVSLSPALFFRWRPHHSNITNNWHPKEQSVTPAHTHSATYLFIQPSTLVEYCKSHEPCYMCPTYYNFQ